MPIEPARYVCFRCRVGYRIADPSPSAERLLCPECRMRFWSAKQPGNVVHVGIYPAELLA